MNDDAELVRDLEQVINKHSRENVSNTPDFILAEYLVACLRAFETTSLARERWYGRSLQIEFNPESDIQRGVTE